MSEVEVEQRWQARIDLINSVKARNRAARQEKDALDMGLGDAVQVARDIDKKAKELSREFKVAPLKGVRKQATVTKRQQADQRRKDAKVEREYNPKLRGLADVDGVITDENGRVGLQDLREQRPDLFDMKPMRALNDTRPNRRAIINRITTAAGRKDRDGYKPTTTD